MITKVALLFDESNDWIYKYFQKFNFNLDKFEIKNFYNYEEINNFDIVFLLGYTRIVKKNFLERNKLTLVIHESDLPKGKGFSPIQWQLLEGKSNINICLIEAKEKVDSGDIFLKKSINFNGTELYDEIREKQAIASFEIIKEFLKKYPFLKPKKQVGEESIYLKRTKNDSELNIQKSIEENFNLLRIGNNEEWPSFFYYKGVKFLIKIYKEVS